ncbi:MAG: hypothetical protein ACI8S6_005492, partial [Myxococcota bacterium]
MRRWMVAAALMMAGCGDKDDSGDSSFDYTQFEAGNFQF